MENFDRSICENCFYCKVREFDAEKNKISWGPWCMREGEPIKWNIAAQDCEAHKQQKAARADKDKQLALKYAISNKRKR